MEKDLCVIYHECPICQGNMPKSGLFDSQKKTLLLLKVCYNIIVEAVQFSIMGYRMKKSVTIKDVAAYTGLSVGTVSMALNGSTKVAEKTKKTVEMAVKELGFRKNPFARSLSTKTSKIIGCIVPDITNQFYGEMVGHLQKELVERDYGMIVGFANEDRNQEARLISQFIDRGVDGIISVPVTDPKHDISQIRSLYEESFPLVFISAHYRDIPHYTVMADLEDGMYQLTFRFLKEGYRNIACVFGNLNLIPSSERLKGVKRAFDEAGVKFDSSCIYQANGVTYFGGYSVVSNFNEQKMPDVILAINDIVAMGIISALRTKGLKVPEEIKVAGFDDISNAAFLETPLTTVSQSIELMCKETVKLLLNRLAGKNTFTGIQKVPTELRIRESAY